MAKGRSAISYVNPKESQISVLIGHFPVPNESCVLPGDYSSLPKGSCLSVGELEMRKAPVELHL